MIFPDIFTEMAVLLMVAAIGGALGVSLRQPLIVSFIAVGILVGPSVLGWVSADDQIDLLAKFGHCPAAVRGRPQARPAHHPHHGPGGTGDRARPGAVYQPHRLRHRAGAWHAPVTALYVAVALTFSSTIIIVKLLSDKREVDTLHGRIAAGLSDCAGPGGGAGDDRPYRAGCQR